MATVAIHFKNPTIVPIFPRCVTAIAEHLSEGRGVIVKLTAINAQIQAAFGHCGCFVLQIIGLNKIDCRKWRFNPGTVLLFKLGETIVRNLNACPNCQVNFGIKKSTRYGRRYECRHCNHRWFRPKAKNRRSSPQKR